MAVNYTKDQNMAAAELKQPLVTIDFDGRHGEPKQGRITVQGPLSGRSVTVGIQALRDYIKAFNPDHPALELFK